MVEWGPVQGPTRGGILTVTVDGHGVVGQIDPLALPSLGARQGGQSRHVVTEGCYFMADRCSARDVTCPMVVDIVADHPSTGLSCCYVVSWR